MLQYLYLLFSVICRHGRHTCAFKKDGEFILKGSGLGGSKNLSSVGAYYLMVINIFSRKLLR